MIMSKIGEPILTSQADEFLQNVSVGIPNSSAIPKLWEPENPVLEIFDDERLVELKHSRITNLNSYWLSGWKNAVKGCWLRDSVAKKLYEIANELPERWGLGIFDAWRPLALQNELFEAACANPKIPEGLFAIPSSDPTTPPPHLTGGAVDLTFTVDDVPLAPGSGFDDVTPAAKANYLEKKPGFNREFRRFLYWTMHSQDFIVFEEEWWHFEFGTRRWGALTGQKAKFGVSSPFN
tara:strand:+ start:399 stop:1106 length:708 start_codon:yes stop_codon:yes gene_type:complete